MKRLNSTSIRQCGEVRVFFAAPLKPHSKSSEVHESTFSGVNPLAYSLHTSAYPGRTSLPALAGCC